jgi:hypothetical protein
MFLRAAQGSQQGGKQGYDFVDTLFNLTGGSGGNYTVP